MQVKDLIEKLQAMKQDYEVNLILNAYDYIDITGVVEDCGRVLLDYDVVSDEDISEE